MSESDHIYLEGKLRDRGYPGLDFQTKSATYLQQVAVLNKVLGIYLDRSKTRGELWAEFDVHDALHHCKSKLARAQAAVGRLELGPVMDSPDTVHAEALDSLYDLINYAAFAVRHLTGEKPNG